MHLSTSGDTDIINLSPQVEKILKESKIAEGLLTVFVGGSTAGITTIEYEPGLVKDLKSAFERLAPKNIRYAHEEAWHDGNGHSHVRAALMGPSCSFPIAKGKIQCGTWQQIVLVDFDNRPRERKVLIQVLG